MVRFRGPICGGPSGKEVEEIVRGINEELNGKNGVEMETPSSPLLAGSPVFSVSPDEVLQRLKQKNRAYARKQKGPMLRLINEHMRTMQADLRATPEWTPEAAHLESRKRPAQHEAAPSPRRLRRHDTHVFGEPTAAPYLPSALPAISLEDIHGMDAVCKRLREDVVFPLQHPRIVRAMGGVASLSDSEEPVEDVYSSSEGSQGGNTPSEKIMKMKRLRHPGHMLLSGPSGCGKSALAQAVAASAGVPFFKVTSTELIVGVSGESEANIRKLFMAASARAPSLVFIDELHLICPQLETSTREMEKRILAQLGDCMDLLRSSLVIVLGATHRLEHIDISIRRRFHEIVLPQPDVAAREAILRGFCADLATAGVLHAGVVFRDLALATPGFVGGDLEGAIDLGWKFALRRIQDNLPESAGDETSMIRSMGASLCVTQEDLLRGCNELLPCSKREGFASVPDTQWADVGGLESLRKELTELICDPIRYPELFQAAGLDGCEGVLLYGPPGCGKTLVARALANESNANFILVNGPELLNKYVGESERAIREVFRRAETAAPALIFFDEFDALCPKRGDDDSNAGTRTVNTLLTELSGVRQRRQVYVVAATNRPDVIDPAMLRSGRLERRLFVPQPSENDRVSILISIRRRFPIDTDSVCCKTIASKTKNFNGADLFALAKQATRLALQEVIASDCSEKNLPNVMAEKLKTLVKHRHFESALEVVHPTISDEEYDRYSRLRQRMEQ